jgi:hypothetical protein
VAYPFIFHEDFESGGKGNFDTKSDTDGALDYPSYKTLAARGWEPYGGAYCLRLVSGLGTNPATLAKADINIALNTTNWFRFNIWFSPDFACTATDTVHLLELSGAASAVTVAFGFKITITTNVINLGIGAAAATAVPDNFSSEPIERGRWYTVELKVLPKAAAAGTLDVYVTKDRGTQATTPEIALTGLTNIAVTDGLLGLKNHLTTTTGTILIDDFIQSDTQLYHSVRYPENRLMTKTGHAFVGPGVIEMITLLGGGAADSVCNVYDSDAAGTSDLVASLSNGVSSETVTRVTPIHVSKGAYITLSGTASANGPRALVKIASAPNSAGTVRDLGRARS